MNVRDLISELGKIEDKSMIVNVTQMCPGEYFADEATEVEIDNGEVTIY
ncbi:hypothetical protein RAK27_11840 [Carnobacterium maltaromaticum]|uniref:BC1881 family protein n=1 Tax=Carnobacterium maltaromaticum TaxID=2751 RepID=A0AAW9K470_CARML|nr:hypothetical protein [Carnobacterium maltaromaticum]MDZ5759355.1 hypothetical protein [Carnobacterium maltaromaticum]